MNSFKKDEFKNSAKELLCGIIFFVVFVIDIIAFGFAIGDKSIAGFVATLIFGVAIPAMVIKDILATRVNTVGLTGRGKDELTVKGLKYIAGVPILRINTDCEIIFEENGIDIVKGNFNYFIEYHKMLNISIETKTTVKEYTGFSLSNAIIGGSLLGLPGAIFFGITDKKKKLNTNYFVIKYKSDGNIKYAIFGPVDYTNYHKLQARIADVIDKIN